MNEQDRKRNQAAVNRLEDKLDKIHKINRQSQTTLLLVLIVVTVICVLALGSLIRLSYIDKMQEDTLDQLMYMQQEEYTDAYNEEMSSIEGIVDNGAKVAVIEQDELASLGEFKITHYCPCAKCCGKTDGITYTGTQATAGRTIGVDPDVIPLGSTVYISGQAYVAEDTGGGIRDKHIDMFVDSHDEALRLGVKYTEVFI